MLSTLAVGWQASEVKGGEAGTLRSSWCVYCCCWLSVFPVDTLTVESQAV